MEKIEEFFGFIIATAVIFGFLGAVIYGIFFYPSARKQDMLDNYYISSYEVHYLDGATDTAYVVGPYSNTESVDYETTTNYDDGKGYLFCGIQGICRVRLLNYKKSYPKFGAIYDTTITFKNNK